MMLERKHFADFFAAVHKGFEPFAWQERLLDELLDRGAWPQRIVAPTGAGKTAAIDVHVFATALTAGGGPRLPRRLAMVVGRRVLVDDQYEHADAVAGLLAAAGDGVLAEVAARLRAVAVGDVPLVVARLRGGVVPSREWRDDPAGCAVLCATPDMWGSRVLFQGYGTARRARPREAGLLALDAAVVVDEAHLARQLLTTARRVGQLVEVAEEPVPVPGLQVVETTATPPRGTAAAGRSVGVTPSDLSDSLTLEARLTRPKPVRLVPVKDWPASSAAQRRRVAAALADEVLSLLAEPPQPDAAHTIGCYVNTVTTAVEVTRVLRARRRPDGGPVRTVMVCGHARPADLQRLRRHPGVLSPTGNAGVDVLVSTQSLEVGVDLDLAGVVTELAPGSALAQRAGRVNRRGLRPFGAVRVIAPTGALTDRARSGPYTAAELTAALDWVTHRADDPAGMAPWALLDNPPPEATRRRMLFQRPELADAWHWARTSDELAAEPELDLWLSEDFDEESRVGLVVRDAMPDDADAVELIRLLPPREHEIFTVPLGTARAVVVEAGRVGDDGARAVVRVRGDDVSAIDPGRFDLRPGDVFVVDSGTAAFTPSTSGATDGFSPPVPVRPDEAEGIRLARAEDVFHDGHAGTPPPGQVMVRLEPAAWAERAQVTALLKEYAELFDGAAERPRRDQLARLLRQLQKDLPEGPRALLIDATVRLLGERIEHSDVALHCHDDGQPLRAVVVDRRRAWADERLRQRWLPQAAGPVLLDDHQAAVAERAAAVAAAVGLPAALVDALRLAGRHHDDGKTDVRFQASLGATDQILAKSGGRPLAGSRQRTDLPARWRHEQRSALLSWAPLHAALSTPYAILAARLVGTSHGHGRHSFPHTASELLTSDADEAEHRLAEDLFDLGGWDHVIEDTHRRWGVWGCAYLEALLRAADGQVSAEGR